MCPAFPSTPSTWDHELHWFMVSAPKSAFNFHIHGLFCFVCKYQIQQSTFPCLPHLLSVSGKYHEHTQEISLGHTELSSQKNTMVNAPEETGSVNEILLPVVWRQSKLYFQSQTPTPTPPMSVCPLVFTHKLLTGLNWSQSSTPCIQLLSHQGQVSVLAFPACP